MALSCGASRTTINRRRMPSPSCRIVSVSGSPLRGTSRQSTPAMCLTMFALFYPKPYARHPDASMWNYNATSVDIFVRGQQLKKAECFLRAANIPYEVVIEDMQRAIDTENPSLEETELWENRNGRLTNPVPLPPRFPARIVCCCGFLVSVSMVTQDEHMKLSSAIDAGVLF